VPSRLDAAIRRAMAKDPAERFESMNELVAELEACRRALGDGEDTIVLPAPVRRRPGRRGARSRRIARALVLSLLALLLVGAAAVGAFALAGVFDSSDETPASGTAVAVQAIGAYDPFGGDGEHDDEAGRATDKDPTTAWQTETYENFEDTKDGVGLVVDAGERTNLAQVTLTTETPGFSAEIRAGPSPSGPFDRRISPNLAVGGTTTFKLNDAATQYFVVWITSLQGAASINEVKARTS
jgi:eukaryotic-like serine/threonine-protein kinase